MKTCFPYLDKIPRQHKSAFIAPGAYVIGDVELLENASVFYNSVLRGDINSIKIGARSNIQDNCTIHLSDDFGVVVGDDVTVGHGAILHACEIGNACLVGMSATIMDGVKIGAGSIVAAGALVPPGKTFPPRSLIKGSPAKLVRQTTDAELVANYKMAQKYLRVVKNHKESLGHG